ncbi:MAG: carbohydrate ABC transporter permease [Bacillota bacterium]|nr:carbohydrate ABC transporter permease [Bacillota bacterium]
MLKITKRQHNRTFPLFDIINILLLVVLLLIIIYPLYFTIIASVSDPHAVVSGKVYVWITGLQFDAYKYVFRYIQIWIGYRNSIINTFFGTILALILTVPAAYALSKKGLPGRSFLMTLFIIIMYFSGGLIPTYLIVRGIGLLDKRLTLIIIGSFSVFNLIITRTYFQTSIPESLYEAARVDGSSEIRSFFQIALPLSKPIIAVIALYYGVSKWNDFFNALVYVRSSDLVNLQIVLRNILLTSETILRSTDFVGTEEELAALVRLAYMAQAMKYSIIFIASAPLLISYPFVQKHFVKGVMIGSIKG